VWLPGSPVVNSFITSAGIMNERKSPSSTYLKEGN
jgi:hypothetical protein